MFSPRHNAYKMNILIVFVFTAIACATTGVAAGASLQESMHTEIIIPIKDSLDDHIYKNIEPDDIVEEYQHRDGVRIANSHKILFDTQPTIIDAINIGDENYYIIKHNNHLEFANRLDIYRSDGTLVSDKNIARKVFDIYSWKMSIDELNEFDRSTFEHIYNTSKRMSVRCSRVHSLTSPVVSAIDKAKTIEFDGYNAWNAARALSSELRYLEETTREIDEVALDGLNKSSLLNTYLPNTVSNLDRYDRGAEVKWDEFAYYANGTGYAMDNFYHGMRSPDNLVDTVIAPLRKANKKLNSIGFHLLDAPLNSLISGLENEKIIKYDRDTIYFVSYYMHTVDDADGIESDAYAKWSTSISNDKAILYIYGLIFIIFAMILLSVVILWKHVRKSDYLVVCVCIMSYLFLLVILSFMFKSVVALVCGIVISIVVFIVAMFLVGLRDDVDLPASMFVFVGASIVALSLFTLFYWHAWKHGMPAYDIMACLYAIDIIFLWMVVVGAFNERIASIGLEWLVLHGCGLFDVIALLFIFMMLNGAPKYVYRDGELWFLMWFMVICLIGVIIGAMVIALLYGLGDVDE